MSNALPPILDANPERQAVPTQRGFVYQIWQSLYAWITLNDDEIIYLEGAEDFDVYAPEEVQTVQVRDTKGTGSVTLRTKKVLEALRNFWETQERNPKRKVYLRYLTTSDRGKEQDDTFGGKKGLDYWDLCKSVGTDLMPLKNFLITHLEQLDKPGEYGVKLIGFLKATSDDELLEQLISRVTWDTGSQPMDIVQQMVKEVLILHGNNNVGVPPSDSVEAMHRLLKKICDTVTSDSQRQLTKSDFLVEFEAGTMESMPKSEARRLRNAFNSLTNSSLSITSFGEVLHHDPGLHFRRPLLPNPCLPRREIVAEISKRLKTQRIVVVRGSVSTGKTVAALLTAAQSDWIWIDLRYRIENEVEQRLKEMFSLAQDSKQPISYVLDDFDFRMSPKKYEDDLIEFLFLVLSKGGRILITTQRETPSRLFSHFPDDISEYPVPWMRTREISSFASDFGCTARELASSWAYVIKFNTGGHPKLVHAWLHYLKSLGWPAPENVEGDEPHEVNRVRREARQDLMEKISSEQARTLVYRLSVLSEPFRRDQAVAIGARQIGTPPAGIFRPGEMFDQLLGPWIEEIGAGYHRISPLLAESAGSVYTEDYVSEIDDAIAYSLGECGDLTHIEARAILVHGLRAGSKEPVLKDVLGLIDMAATSNAWPAMARNLIPIAYMSLTPGQIAFPADLSISLLLRDLQFQIALAIGHETVARTIVELWEQEFASVADVNFRLRMRVAFISRVIAHFELRFPFEFVINRTLEALSILNKAEEIGGQDYAQGISDSKVTEQLLTFVGARCREISELEILFSTLEMNQHGIRNIMLSLFGQQTGMVVLLIDRSWLSAANSASPDWQRVMKLLHRVVEDGRQWGADFLMAAAGRALSIVQDEYLKKPEEAFRTLGEIERNLSAPQTLIENSRAVIEFHLGHYGEALEIWGRIIPDWSDDPIWTVLQSCRLAQIAASRQGHWEETAGWAKIGQNKAFRKDLRIEETGFLADEAFARWKLGDTYGAIHGFAEVLVRLPTIPNPNSNLRAYTLVKLVGHGIAWMGEVANKKDEFGEPSPACFSNPAVNEEIKNFPMGADVDLWRILAQIECEKRLGRSIFSIFEKVCSGSTLPDPLWWLEYFRICHSVVNSEFDDLILLYAVSLKKFALAYMETGEETSDEVSEHLASLFDLLLASFAKAAHDGTLAALPPERWRADSESLGIKNDNLEQLFTQMGGSSRLGYSGAKGMLQAKDREIRVLAAIIILASRSLEPEAMFLASTYAVVAMSYFWGRMIDIEIGNLVSSRWLKIANDENFRRTTSSSNVEQILNACNDVSNGFRKAARVILAARSAVSLYIDEETDNELKRLAK